MLKFLHNKQKKEEKPDKWTYSTCNFCSYGCGLFLGKKDNNVINVTGNYEHPVNKGKLCPVGLESHQIFNAKNRGRTPLFIDRKGNETVISFDHAFSQMRDVFRNMQKEYGLNSIGLIAGPSLTFEEIYTASKIGRLGLKTDYFNFYIPDSYYGDVFGNDVTPATLNDIRETRCFFIMGDDLGNQSPLLTEEILRAKKRNKAKLIVVSSRITELAREADYHFFIPPFTEIVLLNTILNVIIKNGAIDLKMIESFTEGFKEVKKIVRPYHPSAVAEFLNEDKYKIEETAYTIGEAESTLFLWCLGTDIRPYLRETINLMHALALITGNFRKPGASSLVLPPQGNLNSVHIAGFSETLPGNRPFTKENCVKLSLNLQVALEEIPQTPTKTVREILEAALAREIKALWIIASDVVSNFPDRKLVCDALESVDFLIVQDPFYPTFTAKYTDLYLPSAIWGEKTGTYINFERRIGLAKKAVSSPGIALTDREIFVRFATKMGYKNLVRNLNSNKKVFEELKRVLRGSSFDISEIDYSSLEKLHGQQLAMKDIQKGKLLAFEYEQPQEEPDIRFPFILRLEQERRPFHSLSSRRLDDYVEINEKEARKLNLSEGEMVEVSSRRASLHLKLKVSENVSLGEALIPSTLESRIFDLLASDDWQTAVSVEKLVKKRAGKILQFRA